MRLPVVRVLDVVDVPVVGEVELEPEVCDLGGLPEEMEGDYHFSRFDVPFRLLVHQELHDRLETIRLLGRIEEIICELATHHHSRNDLLALLAVDLGHEFGAVLFFCDVRDLRNGNQSDELHEVIVHLGGAFERFSILIREEPKTLVEERGVLADHCDSPFGMARLGPVLVGNPLLPFFLYYIIYIRIVNITHPCYHGCVKQELETIWDVAVIGGGPAGMMAAGRAAERGLKVIVVEKNATLGKKLLITGGGRCNVTNAEFDTRKLLSKFKENDKFLFSAFSQWAVKETLDFFHINNMETKVEKEQRVFPITNKAQSVWDVLVENLKKFNVAVLSNTTVTGFEVSEDGRNIVGAKIKGPAKIIKAKSFILATGGVSRPETGSTGDGYAWLKKIGHTVIDPTPSLVPLAAKDDWITRLAGVSLSDIKITTFQNGVKQDSKKGKVLFTHVGVSGPTILNMSKDIGELLKYGDVVVSLDILPQLDPGALNAKLQDIFRSEHNNKKFKNSLAGLVPSSMAPIIVELSGIDPEVQCNSITREQRINLVQLLKNIPINVEGLLGVDKAIISSGGVILDEVDFKTMQSRLFPNLYLIGDILNIDRPSGGYSLQLCWTTGFVAGNSIH